MIRFWTVDGKKTQDIALLDKYVYAIAWSNDAELIGAGGSNNWVGVWRSDGFPGPTFSGHCDFVLSVAWRPCRHQLASCSRDSTVFLWDATTGLAEWSTLILNDDQSITFSPVGQIVHGDRELVDKELVYLVETDEGTIEMLKPSEFEERVKTAGAGEGVTTISEE